MATVRCRLESVFQYFDEVRWEHPYCSWVASQSAHPPQAIAGIQCFDQVAFNKAKVAFRFASPRICCPDPAGES